MTSQQEVRADLHNHWDTDNRITDKRLSRALKIALKRLGPGGVLGLVNYDDGRFERLVYKTTAHERVTNVRNAILFPEFPILVVKGEEVYTKEGLDLLLIGVDRGKHPTNGRTIADTLKEADDLGALKIFPHPYYKPGLVDLATPHIADMDGIEVHNGAVGGAWLMKPSLVSANKKAQKLYEANSSQTSRFISSDGHTTWEIGRSWMQIPKFPFLSRQSLVDLLRQALKVASERNMSYMAHNSCFGAIDHAVKLTRLIALEKMGLREKPTNTKHY